jgi:hypothetical protein
MLTIVGALCSGALIASNMGHIATAHLDKAGSGGSKSGTNTINLPYGLGPNILTAKNLMDDITFANVASVSRFVETSDGFELYTGRKGSPSPDFNLASGECYYVTMLTTTDYTVVGNDKPSFAVTLNAPQAGVSKSGSNFVSLPFNITAGTAKALMDDIGFSNVNSVSRFIKTTDGLEIYTGRKGTPNASFPITHDECYFIVMGGTVNYTASHY